MKFLLSFILIFTSLSAYCKFTSFEDAKVYKFLTIAGQPTKATLDKVKEERFDIVLNLRNPDEFDKFNEKEYVENKGLTYSNIPFFDKDKNITKENINKISRYVEKNKDKKIFIHCSSGNRVSAWLLIHLNKDHKMPLDKALNIAKGTGLTKEKLKEQTLSFIKSIE